LRVVGIVVMLALLAGCGYKAALYLPGSEPGKKNAER
jgi:predicted small lipoprotein YifL